MPQADRFPPIAPAELTPEQHKAYDESIDICQSTFGTKFIYKDNSDRFIGPFAPLLYTPELNDAFFKAVVALGKLPGLPPKAKEVAILATGSTFKAGYELYAHGKVAQSAHLTDKQIEMVKRGEKPTGEDKLDKACEAAFDAAIELSRKQGPLSDKTFQELVDAMGKDGALAVIHYVGLYAWTCVLLNGVNASVPEEK